MMVKNQLKWEESSYMTIRLETTSPDCYSVYWNNNPTDWYIYKSFGSGNPNLYGFGKNAKRIEGKRTIKNGVRFRSVGDLHKCKEELVKILMKENK